MFEDTVVESIATEVGYVVIIMVVGTVAVRGVKRLRNKRQERKLATSS